MKTNDPGPVVLACLYRNAYDEQNPVSYQNFVHILKNVGFTAKMIDGGNVDQFSSELTKRLIGPLI